MDITDVFRNYVQNLKLHRNLTGVGKASSLKIHNRKNEFNSKSKDIVYHITKLRDCLFEHKQRYININVSTSSGPSLSDLEREQIDLAAYNINKHCASLLKELAAFNEKNSSSTQLYEHQKGVLEIVDNYLKSVSRIYSEMKECYSKRLASYNSMMKVTPKEQKADLAKEEVKPSYNQDLDESNVHTNPIVDELTEEELQMFEVENADLINELNNLRGEVHAIEQKVTHIAELQGTFTEMVLQQDTDIQRIDTRLIGSTENVRDANDELRKAVQNNASFRFYLLFFILMMSITLLFLNWYND
ncbi:hypothetical protein V9T40_013399 [Parthenolecanium corni]|uniref:t-SNARE coiled-coil homology domain-containing protein n=1 Tax=Parthenolecanium corni TaxID=536013 RepID=A0AAN9Y628_9HEMI